MKKAICLTIMIILLLSSCSSGGENLFNRFFTSDQDKANKTFEKVLASVQNKDKGTLRTLFSEKSLNEAKDFDGNINALFDFFQGDFVSYDDKGALLVSDGKNDDGTGRNWKSFETTYDVETSRQKYRFAIKEFKVDTTNSNNIGICSLYIILADNTDMKFAYWGDQEWTPGIVIDNKFYFDE